MGIACVTSKWKISGKCYKKCEWFEHHTPSPTPTTSIGTPLLPQRTQPHAPSQTLTTSPQTLTTLPQTLVHTTLPPYITSNPSTRSTPSHIPTRQPLPISLSAVPPPQALIHAALLAILYT